MISDASRMTTLKELASEYWANRPMELAAALSYYTLLSLAPLILVAVAVAGLIFERATVEGKIVTEIRLLVGVEGSEVVQTVLRHASDPEKSAHSVVIGIAVLLLGATTVFVQLQSSLNRIWKVEERTHASMLWVLVKERLLSLAMVLAVGFLLLVSLLVSAGVAAFGETTLGGLSDVVLVLEGLNVLVSLVVVTLLFAMIFKVMPDAPVAWRDVWVGAVITAVLSNWRCRCRAPRLIVLLMYGNTSTGNVILVTVDSDGTGRRHACAGELQRYRLVRLGLHLAGQDVRSQPVGAGEWLERCLPGLDQWWRHLDHDIGGTEQSCRRQLPVPGAGHGCRRQHFNRQRHFGYGGRHGASRTRRPDAGSSDGYRYCR